MSSLGASIDELQVDLLMGETLSLDEQRLSEGNKALLRSKNSSTDHQVILLDDTIARETTLKNVLLDYLLNRYSKYCIYASQKSTSIFSHKSVLRT